MDIYLTIVDKFSDHITSSKNARKLAPHWIFPNIHKDADDLNLFEIAPRFGL